jgi:hypothetical protein
VSEPLIWEMGRILGEGVSRPDQDRAGLRARSSSGPTIIHRGGLVIHYFLPDRLPAPERSAFEEACRTKGAHHRASSNTRSGLEERSRTVMITGPCICIES